MYRYLPPTTPAVYHAALTSNGPPIMVIGAKTAPNIPLYAIQAKCLAPSLSLYGIDLHTIPVPITAAKVAPIAYKYVYMYLHYIATPTKI